jgi:hypothetical protein
MGNLNNIIVEGKISFSTLEDNISFDNAVSAIRKKPSYI